MGRQARGFTDSPGRPYGRTVNREHLELCASTEWRDLLRDEIFPYATSGARLGDDVLEIGPGPGVTTDLLRHQADKVTAVEVDAELATALAARLAGTNVTVVHGDATDLQFEDGRFTGAIAMTMLHHVQTDELQNRLIAEVARVLEAGGQFVASDSVHSAELAALHAGDTYNPIDPATLEDRLEHAGFVDIALRVNPFGWAAQARRARRAAASNRGP
jgi:SAM-dependent methyltransferase